MILDEVSWRFLMKNALNISGNKVRLIHCILYDQFLIKKLVIGTNYNMFLFFLILTDCKFFQISSLLEIECIYMRLSRNSEGIFFRKEFLPCRAMWITKNWTGTNYNLNESVRGGSLRLARSFYEVNPTQWKVVGRSEERTRTEQILKSEVSSTSSH